MGLLLSLFVFNYYDKRVSMPSFNWFSDEYALNILNKEIVYRDIDKDTWLTMDFPTSLRLHTFGNSDTFEREAQMKTLKDGSHFRSHKRGSTHIFMRKGISVALCGMVGKIGSNASTPSKKHPICKKCEKLANEQKLWGTDLQVEPCPKCGNEGIELFNCGYSTFNPGGGKCPDCGYEVQEFVDWNARPFVLARVWNRGAKAYGKTPQKKAEDKLKKERAKTRTLRKQLRAHGFEPLA